MNSNRCVRLLPQRQWNVCFLLALSLIAVIAGCSGGTQAGSTGQVAAPIVTGFAASPASISAGQSSVLTWAVSGATSVTVSGITGPAVSPITLSPASTTTYTLTATNLGGTTTAAATVTVLQPPVISSFMASPASVPLGASSTLSWSITGATTVSLSGVAGTVTSPTVVKPTATTTYTLTASNASGSATATTTVAVTAAPPTIGSFTASAASITAGQPVTLTWSTAGATSTQVSGVTGAPASPIVVYPDATTTYVLTAGSAGGSVTASVPVTVTAGSALDSGGSVAAGTPGQAVPPTFMGLSIGSNSYQAILGIPATGTNPIYRKLLGNLTAYGGGPLVMRIGGSSTDSQGIPTVTDVSSLAQLATDTGAKFILGVSLAPDVVSTAVQQAQVFTANMPSGSILAAEIGNEPDLYVEQGLRTSYTNAQYLADFATFRAAVLPVMTAVGAKVTGPAWSNSGSLTNLPSFLAQEHSTLALVTQHAYGGNICNTNPVAGDYLLQEAAQSRGTAILSGLAPTHADGLAYRLAESNSINCSGQVGVSNTFQAALWSMDWMARLAGAGVDGINFFGNNNNAYSLFEFNTATSGGSVTFSISSIRPEYYGLVMWQQATQNGARFLPVTYTAAGNEKAYAWLDASGNIRILVLNKDETLSGTFSVTIAGYGAATLTRLTAPSYTSTAGVMLGGQTLDTSADGTFQGPAYGEGVTPAAGVYSFAMPMTSAALLTIPHN